MSAATRDELRFDATREAVLEEAAVELDSWAEDWRKTYLCGVSGADVVSRTYRDAADKVRDLKRRRKAC